MALDLNELMEKFCLNLGIGGPFEWEPIRVGRNSQVYLVHNQSGRWILKHYYQAHELDRRDRLGTEYSFLEFLKKMKISGVPVALGMDRETNCALYSYIPGKPLHVIKARNISQAADFIIRINRYRSTPQARALPWASDACSSLQAHLDLTESRIARLLAGDPGTGVTRGAYEFISTQISPLWKIIKKNLSSRLEDSQSSPAERILSPSDFGFHNTLESESGLSFVDFEYAGWDDPAKLICDFMCQPELPVTAEQGQQFMDRLLQEFTGGPNIKHRVNALLPVHRLKWCCILLNEFRIEDRKRREHAGLASHRLLAQQLGKAQQYFETHLVH